MTDDELNEIEARAAAVAMSGPDNMNNIMPYMHPNGFSTERNVTVAIMLAVGLDATDFRLRDKLIFACAPWIQAERQARTAPKLVAELRRRRASSPAWHDRPTGPGLWFAPKASTKLFGLLARDFDRNPEWFADWPGGRVFGPIPADEEAQA